MEWSTIRGHLVDSLGSLVALRRELHRHPDLALRETRTADRIRTFLETCEPDEIIGGIANTGLAAVFAGARPGPTVMIRAELDALPIDESLDIEHRSRTPGVSHKCGHDGHMAIACGVASLLARHRPASGRVVVLFQPAEETGAGAKAVMSDERFEGIAPQIGFALHNVPGFAEGRIVVKSGPFASASTGLRVELEGSSAHASESHLGTNPAAAVASIIHSLYALPTQTTALGDSAQVTITYAKLGQPSFGVSPGQAQIFATLRAPHDETLERLLTLAESRIDGIARSQGLRVECSREDEFAATTNDVGAVDIVARAAEQAGLSVQHIDTPFPWSEDFGVFGARVPLCYFGLGAGPCPPLHADDYDFPDGVIESGVLALFAAARLASEDAVE